jgi:DtxR family Mn-dependent transcriptional regulator
VGGELEEVPLTPLSEIPPGQTAELRRVSDRDAELLRYVASLGLRVGVRFDVLLRQPFRGPVTIRLLGPPTKDQVLGHELAAELWCEVIPKEAG